MVVPAVRVGGVVGLVGIRRVGRCLRWCRFGVVVSVVGVWVRDGGGVIPMVVRRVLGRGCCVTGVVWLPLRVGWFVCCGLVTVRGGWCGACRWIGRWNGA